MMFVKGKDEAFLKAIMEVMAESAQQTEEERKKAAEYLESTTYAGMRLEEGERSDLSRKLTNRFYALDKKIASAAKKQGRGDIEGTGRDTKSRVGKAVKQMSSDGVAAQLKAFNKEEVELDFNDLLEYMLTPDFEQLDEVSKSTLQSYIVKRAEKHGERQYQRAGGDQFASDPKNNVSRDSAQKYDEKEKSASRSAMRNIRRAAAKLADPSYGVKMTKEEFEQLDEISKGTLGSYIKKATSSSDKRSMSNLSSLAADKLNDPNRGSGDNGWREDHKSFLRSKGVGRAVDRLTKEDVEYVELEEAVGDNHIHVQHVGGGKYKVHAVGKNFAGDEDGGGIKVGEHLSDSELDDFSEMGGKIKHVKPAAAKPMKEARSLSAILDEARGRPSKKASEDDEDEADESPDTGPEADQNIMVHLRKSTDTDGNHDVKFSDGSSHKVPAHVAHKVLGAMEKLKPADRAKIQSHIQQSHANLMAVHKMVS